MSYVITFLVGLCLGSYAMGTFVLWVINHLVWHYWISQGLHVKAAEDKTADILDFTRMGGLRMPPIWTWNRRRRAANERHERAEAAKVEKAREDELRRQAVDELKAEMRAEAAND